MRQTVTAMCLLGSLVLNCGDSLCFHTSDNAAVTSGVILGGYSGFCGMVWVSWPSLGSRCEFCRFYPTVISLAPHSPWAQNPPSHPYGNSLPGSQGRWRKMHFLFQEPNRKGRDDLKSDWTGSTGSNWKCPLNPLPFLRRKLTDKEGSRPWRAQRSTQKEVRGDSSP